MPKKPIKPLKKQLIFCIIENNIKCAYCGRKYDEKNKKTVDHIVPKSKGGQTELSNILICCSNCNSIKKANEDIEDFIKKNKRARESLRKYFEKIEDLWINGKNYHRALEWVYNMIKKEGK